ncbi:MAG: hypothetical protein PGN33_22820 [Methylobacterium radiotolerans]
MNTGFGFAVFVLAFPLGAGLFVWFVGLATAAEINAQARLLEAQNAAKAAPLPDSDTGGKS